MKVPCENEGYAFTRAHAHLGLEPDTFPSVSTLIRGESEG